MPIEWAWYGGGSAGPIVLYCTAGPIVLYCTAGPIVLSYSVPSSSQAQPTATVPMAMIPAAMIRVSWPRCE